MPARLETYVEELRAELRDLPVAVRAQELAEVRTHLESLKSANVELGLTEEEAEAAAVSQFGGSQAVGKAVKKTHWRDQWDTLPGVALAQYGVCEIFGSVFSMVIRGNLPGKNQPSTMESILALTLPTLVAYFCIGILIGRLLPKYSIRGSLLLFAFSILSILKQYLFMPSNMTWLNIAVIFPNILVLLGIIAGLKIVRSGRGKRGVA